MTTMSSTQQNQQRDLWAAPSRAISSKCFMKKLAMTKDNGKPTTTPSVCSKNWQLKLEKEEVRTWQKSLTVSSSKRWLKGQGLSNGHLGE
jgi:hypothetical protein